MSIQIPTYEALPSNLFRLRWRFSFSDGRKDKVGIWNGSSKLPTDSAWAVDKSNLAYAYIEGEVMQGPETGKTLVFLEVPGQVYASMQWEAYSKMPGMVALHGTQSYKLRAYVSGLSILTADEKITIWVNGTSKRCPLSEQDKKFKIHEHTLGS